ncbi:transposase [Anoxybacillus flavithermus]|nr:transposase [Anoxybacillus flavithermus]
MKRMELVVTAKIRLLPTETQHLQLVETMQAMKQALNFASKVAYEQHLLSSFKKLRVLVYRDLRELFGLKSQMACNVCTIVAGVYASMKSNGERTLAVFKKPKLQYSYNRDYSFTKDGQLSIGTLNKRIKMPFLTKGQERYFDGSWEFGTGTLVYKKGKFYLHVAAKKVIHPPTVYQNVVGVDMGMRFLVTAVDSRDRHLFIKGNHIQNVKARYVRLRKELQQRNTKSAKRKLKKIAGQENRFMTNVNHCVSKALVRFAGKHSLLVLEDLTGINDTVCVRKKDRYVRFTWSFAQLRSFIEYKARLHDSHVLVVHPAYTSQQCPTCGFTHKNNRKKQIHTFICEACGYTSNDDRVGALNLRQKGIEYHHGVTTQA